MTAMLVGGKKIFRGSPCFVIAEIGHNHQGDFQKAKEMIRSAAECGVDAVKFQKRDNRSLFTKAMYAKPYDNENSFGKTYGEHREFLEFGWDQYVELKEEAHRCKVAFMCTPFDVTSVDFLEKLDIDGYKIASGDITNTHLLEYVARKGRPVFVSTGASTMDEIRSAYKCIKLHNDQICLLHAVSSYPANYNDLNLRFIEVLRHEFPDVIIGYSGHDSGILAGVVAYMLGATVLEKHFTLNRAWKGTDHRFSLEPVGMRKQVRDLRRIDESLGSGLKVLQPFEVEFRAKLGKSLYFKGAHKAGHILAREDVSIKAPGGGIPPYDLERIIGKKLVKNVAEEHLLTMGDLE